MPFFRFWLNISVVKVSFDHGPARLPGSQEKNSGACIEIQYIQVVDETKL